MKKATLKRLFAGMLVVAMAFGLVACGAKEAEGPKKDVSLYDSGDGWNTINDPLSWDAINEFDVVHDGMTVEEARKLAVDFFRYSKTAVWTPSETFTYKIKESKATEEVVEGGILYGGLPYISTGSGSVYRLMDYMDEETHVVDVKNAVAQPVLFGNQCSNGSYVGVGRVINSVKFDYTRFLTLKSGLLKVGDYTYDESVEVYKSGEYDTATVVITNGPERMYECYAQLLPGDVIIYYKSDAGHVVMISDEAHVERNADGSINPDKSYVTVIDQTAEHDTLTNAAGDTFSYERNVDKQWTFTYLVDHVYIPHTFKEFTGEDPIDSSKNEFSHTGTTITMDELYSSYVTSNYGIFDIYASFYNEAGIEIYKTATRADRVCRNKLAFVQPGTTVMVDDTYSTDVVEEWGKTENLNISGKITVKVYAQISTGERPVLWEGELSK